MARQVAKPREFRTTQDLAAGCEYAEWQQEVLGGRLIIYRDTFNPKTWVQRIVAFVWARQVEQDENDVCDSPYLQVLEARCTTHVQAQMEDYSPALHVSHVVGDVAGNLLDSLDERIEAAQGLLNGTIEVDTENIASLDQADGEAVVAHDKATKLGHLRQTVESLVDQREDLQALSDRAHRSENLLIESCQRHVEEVQQHFREQALFHLRWARRARGLKTPYKLPGTLEAAPDVTAVLGEKKG
ncbi:MAG: hypothetical protein SOV74_10275 [Coriobacteriales bacterium]|nr:hypothetical protein [Coriobacteriales bacterium]